MTLPCTWTHQALSGRSQPLGGESGARARPRRRVRVLPQHIALAAECSRSRSLLKHRTSCPSNGYANTFYSAAVRSMLDSFHNFFFVSFDPGGMVTVDKPPLGLWVQGLSAELFGFHPLSLLLPEAIAGVLAVGALYWVVTPRFGPAAGVMSALALAVFPSFVAVSRDNDRRRRPDPAADPRLRCRVARDRLGQAADAPWLRRARRARIQHQDPRRLSRRPRARARLHRLCAGIARAPRCSAARRGHRTGARIVLGVDRSSSEPRSASQASDVCGRLDEQHRAGAHVRIQRLRARAKGRSAGPVRSRSCSSTARSPTSNGKLCVPEPRTPQRMGRSPQLPSGRPPRRASPPSHTALRPGRPQSPRPRARKRQSRRSTCPTAACATRPRTRRQGPWIVPAAPASKKASAIRRAAARRLRRRSSA